MYRGQIARDELEKDFVGTNHEFLASLGMHFTIETAKQADLQRAEELTVRTNQLNSTGRTYSYDELDALRESPDHLLLVASLTDTFGSYGKIGLALVEKEKWVRIAAAVGAALCMLCILFTFSRGGLLTLVTVGGLLIWRSQRRFLVAGLLGLGLVGFLFFSSSQLEEQYLERASSISKYEEDGSALGRLNAWQTSWRVFLDYPVFGVGPNNLEAVFFRYSPDNSRFRVTHNSYLQLLSECGLPSLLFFLGAIGAALWRLQRLRRMTALPWI
jgi:O-antigen ligase